MFQFLCIIFFSHVIVGDELNYKIQWELLEKWTIDFVWQKLQPVLETMEGNEPVVVRHFVQDRIHGTYSGVLAESIVNKLEKNRYKASGFHPIFVKPEKGFKVDDVPGYTILITSNTYAKKANRPHVQELSPHHITINFSTKVKALPAKEECILRKEEFRSSSQKSQVKKKVQFDL